MLLIALTIGFASWCFAPPVLKIGMSRVDVMNLLNDANAESIHDQSVSFYYYPDYFGPTGDPTIIEQRAIEFARADLLFSSGKNFNTYWRHPSVGRFELHFRNEQLDSIIRWRGENNDHVKRLVLRTGADRGAPRSKL